MLSELRNVGALLARPVVAESLTPERKELGKHVSRLFDMGAGYLAFLDFT